MRTLLRVLIPIGVLAAGAGVFVLMARSRPRAARGPEAERAPLVETVTVRAGTHGAVVQAHGTVVPAREVALQPEVPGRVRWVSPALVQGGRVREGDAIVRIDDRDYRARVERARGEVARAHLALEQERGAARVARREWDTLARESPGQDRSLALREPHVAAAEAALRAAEGALDEADLNLARTTLRAPFHALVLSERIEVGQQVGPQAPVATLVASDVFHVQVALPVEHLPWIDIPGVGGRQGARARVEHEAGAERILRRGRVVRLLGDLDPSGAMARALIEIEDPLGPAPDDGGGTAGLPLLLGAFVRVEIEGREIPDAVRVPRAALRDGDRVHVAAGDGAHAVLQVVPVAAVWREPDAVWVRDGDLDGRRVITSRLAAPVPGMKLRVTQTPAAAPAATDGDGARPAHGEASGAPVAPARAR